MGILSMIPLSHVYHNTTKKANTSQSLLPSLDTFPLSSILYTQPKQIWPRIMPTNIHKRPRYGNLIEIQIRVDDPLLIICQIRREFASIRSKYSRTAPAWRIHLRSRLRAHSVNSLRCEDRCAVQDERLRFYRVCLRHSLQACYR